VVNMMSTNPSEDTFWRMIRRHGVEVGLAETMVVLMEAVWDNLLVLAEKVILLVTYGRFLLSSSMLHFLISLVILLFTKFFLRHPQV
jgi:hypothetical protein